MNPIIEKSVNFIRSIGIDVSFGTLEEACILPGLAIDAGAIIIDIERLKYPGDLLHEAGHIAVVPLAERSTLNGEAIGKRTESAAEEMMAMAWSYAACRYLGIDPEEIFHDGGYKGGGSSLILGMECPCPIGVPMLQYYGMSYYGAQAAEQGIEPFPAMVHWIKE